jgi:hypothetical protein
MEWDRPYALALNRTKHARSMDSGLADWRHLLDVKLARPDVAMKLVSRK